jgi:hypothetical protein
MARSLERPPPTSSRGCSIKDLGDAAGARPLIERALAIDEKTYGPEHPFVATSLSNLGTVLNTTTAPLRSGALVREAGLPGDGTD